MVAILQTVVCALRTQLPLKQGLRHWFSISSALICASQNPTSTKTRIKTDHLNGDPIFFDFAQNPTSTKTRIKTPLFWDHLNCDPTLRTQLPLKQGLRHLNCDPIFFHLGDSEPNFH